MQGYSPEEAFKLEDFTEKKDYENIMEKFKDQQLTVANHFSEFKKCYDANFLGKPNRDLALDFILYFTRLIS